MTCTAATNSAPNSKIFARERGHHRDQRERAVNGMRLRQQVDCARDRNGPEGQK